MYFNTGLSRDLLSCDNHMNMADMQIVSLSISTPQCVSLNKIGIK